MHIRGGQPDAPREAVLAGQDATMRQKAEAPGGERGAHSGFKGVPIPGHSSHSALMGAGGGKAQTDSAQDERHAARISGGHCLPLQEGQLNQLNPPPWLRQETLIAFASSRNIIHFN